MLASISWKPVMMLHLGPVPVYLHGLLIAVGFLAGARLMLRYSRRLGIEDDRVWHVLGWSLAGALAGMRVAWVLGHLDAMRSPLDFFAVWNGGMSLLGGLLGAFAVGFVVIRRSGLPVLEIMDAAAPGLALGIVIGRVSDLVIGDHLGKPTTMPWGFRYAGSDHPFDGAPPIGTIVHPVALYDLLLTGALLAVLLLFVRRQRARGSAIALFALWYPAGRIVLDFFRTDPVRVAGLTGSQITSVLAVALVGVALLRSRRSRGARELGALAE